METHGQELMTNNGSSTHNMMSSQNFDTPRNGREEETNFLAEGFVSPTIQIQRAQRNVDIEKNNEAILLIEQQNHESSKNEGAKRSKGSRYDQNTQFDSSPAMDRAREATMMG